MPVTPAHDVVVVGAGPAGLGVALALQSIGVTPLVVDREDVGASFERWPEEMRLITPSFTSNFWGPIDLNAISPTTSPAFTLSTEHPTGTEYATYLRAVADHHEVEVRSGIEVTELRPLSEGFSVLTRSRQLKARTVVWAAGEYPAVRPRPFPGAHLAVHNGDIRAYRKLDGEERIVIGGAESGVDAAIHLAADGKRVIVLDRSGHWEAHGSDPSLTLSPFTRDRLEEALDVSALELVAGVEVTRVERIPGGFVVWASDGRRWRTASAPILATGFGDGMAPVADLFERDEHDHVRLDDHDASTRTPALHLAGPQVSHEGLVFCFIYKFRQRFAVVARAIGERLGVDTSALEAYRAAGMLLDDLSCCHAECAC